ncbi:MAG: phosphodiester glycosidase family protein [Calothrix sp. C42_A2020_038]|nr:phosphodiester glycosidase family protein [Calothrix sp. C42_A2020_038]
MKKIWLYNLLVITLGMLLFTWRSSDLSITSIASTQKVTITTPQKIQYESRVLVESVVHIVKIPANSKYLVTPVVSDKLNTVEEFAQKHKAIAVLNAGYFDPVNQKSTSYITQQRKLVADPKLNERLVNNPKLKSYLPKILNRSEFRKISCGSKIQYEIAFHEQKTTLNCQIIDAIGAGPKLLPDLTLVEEGFVDNINGRDAIGSNQLNARSAVGITEDGSVLLVMVAQKPETPSGVSLPKLADLMKNLGAKSAMNLDGGSSSSLYYNGKIYNGKIDKQGNSTIRPIKSVLLIK